MLKPKVILVALASLLGMSAAAQPGVPLPYGVGMSLSLGHGTVSVYGFRDSDQQYIDIAKIEGGAEYKQFMKTHIPINGDRHSNNTQSLPQTFLPSWTSLSKQPPVSRMLKALKTAAEAYVEETVKDVAIVLPYDIDENFYYHMKAAAQLSDINAEMRRNTPTAAAAALAQGFWDTDCTQPSELVLAIDYSKEGLTAQLLIHDCTVLSAVSWLYDTDLRPGFAKKDDLVTKLKRLLTTADRSELDFWEVQNRDTAKVSLSGEAAYDKTLRVALESMTLKDGCCLVWLHLPPVNDPTIPTTFAAARWAAYYRGELRVMSVNQDEL